MAGVKDVLYQYLLKIEGHADGYVICSVGLYSSEYCVWARLLFEPQYVMTSYLV
jgi:hypothetical protein